jgi:hypothetical protein
MPVAADAFLVANSPGQRLADRDADILHRVVSVDVQITLGLDLEVDQTVPGHLIEHVLEKRHTGIEPALAGTVEVDADFNLGLQGVPADLGAACRHADAALPVRMNAIL